ncbi:MAG: gluconate 2-dehydrogenase subunit 3 family protein [Burkholderiaceae bacterium]
MSKDKPVTIVAPVRPFTATQQATLAALMNLMIPASRDGRMPAAASLGLYDDPRALPPAARAHLERGLDTLAARAESAHRKPVAELPDSDLNALVEALRADDRAFISALTLHTVARYLEHEQTMTALGLEPRPHWPKGHEVPQGDWDLLEPVRQRGPVWRKI